MIQKTHRLVYGADIIEYDVVFVNRKTLEIAVLPEGLVKVKAPMGSSQDRIKEKVRKRVRWILRQQRYFDQFKPWIPVRQYIGGETHRYLGRQYRLKISKGKPEGVKLVRGYFLVNVKGSGKPEEIKKLLDRWYLDKMKIQFQASLDRCWPFFEKAGLGKPDLRIRRMKTRWGSLSDRGAITLNTELIKAPRDCIDYVVTHELCHLKHKNHDTGFYKLLEIVMPGWGNIKCKLERMQ
ncbi:M48 family metallopeptidase [bacterium]|nr:M48 family metallopeptidase [bacterium]